MSKKLIPDCVGPYSHSSDAENLVFFSGQLGLDPGTNNLKSSFAEQLDQILKNIEALLASQNLTRKNIIKTTIFMTDLKDFTQVNDAYKKFFQEPYPARSTIQVAALPKGALIEIELIASRQQQVKDW
jgi:2-iminobutanoate/2-iminopropanoate deaminase